MRPDVSSGSETAATIVLAELGMLGLSAASAAGLGVLFVPVGAVLMGGEEMHQGVEDARWQWRPFLLTLGIGAAFGAYPYLRFGTGYRGMRDDRFLQASLETFTLMNIGFWSWVLVSESGRNSEIAVFPAPGGGAGISRTWSF